MAASIANLVHETSTTTGSGNFTLLGASNGAQSFNSAFGTGGTDKFYYFITNQGAAEWEVGTGHLSAASTLVRDTIINSSNANAAVVFSAGTKDITCDLPATFQGKTTATSLAFTLDTDGTPLDALTLGATIDDPFGGAAGPQFNSNTGADALAIVSTNAGAFGPTIYMNHASSSPAASDQVGSVVYIGKDSAANTQDYGQIFVDIVDPTSTSEDSKMNFSVYSGGSSLTALTLGGTGPGGNFAHEFDLGSAASGQLLVSGSNSGNNGPNVTVFHDSASPGFGDFTDIAFSGRNSSAGAIDYSTILNVITNATAASETAELRFNVYSSGSAIQTLTLGTTTDVGIFGHKFNHGSAARGGLELYSGFAGANGPILYGWHDTASPAAADEVFGIYAYGNDSLGGFQLWSQHRTVIIDATSGSEDSSMEHIIQSGGSTLTALTLGTTYNSVFAHTFDVGSTDYGQLVVQGSSAGAGGPALILDANSASPAASDQVGLLIFNGRDSGAAIQRYGDIQCLIDDATAASEDSHMLFRVWSAGSALTALTLGTTSGPGDGSPNHMFDIGSSDFGGLIIKNSSNATGGPELNFYHNSASPAANDFPCFINSWGKDSAANDQLYGFMRWLVLDPTSASEDSNFAIGVVSGGSNLTALTLGSSSGLSTGPSAVFDLGGVAGSFEIHSTRADGTGIKKIDYHNSASPAGGDIVSIQYYYGKDSGGADQLYGYMYMSLDDPTAGSEDGSFVFDVAVAGVDTQVLRVRGGTTASAANAFIDNAAGNELKRSTSSGKYKTAISTIGGEDAIGTLSQLRPVRYRSAIASDPQDKEFYGLIAEEVNEIDPQLVHFNEAGEPDGVQYDRVPVLLLAAYRELNNRLKELENAQVRH